MSIDIFNPVGTAINNIDRTSRATDYLTNYNFHVMDVSFAVPAVLSLSAGFRFCTAPEINIEHKRFKEGTFEYPRKVMSSADVNDINFHRGVSLFNSDFYDWVYAYTNGQTNQRKNLLIIHYTDMSTGITSDPTLGFVSFQSLASLVQNVPARAWMLYDCVPAHYKGGSDFDAVAADVSISELTVAPSFMEEFNAGV